MRLNSTRLVAPLTLLSLAVAAGCHGKSPDLTASDSLQRDLELAQASTVSLAPNARDLPPTRVVSALEAGERATTGAGTAARPSHRHATRAPHAPTRHAPPAPAPAATQSVAQKAAEEPQTAPAPAATTVAQDPNPARSENPSASGAGNDGVISVSPTDGDGDGSATVSRRGHGGGMGGVLGGIGGVIGVVIRGGVLGDGDHCERDRPGSRGSIPIGMGIPFPGRGSIGVPRGGVWRPPY